MAYSFSTFFVFQLYIRLIRVVFIYHAVFDSSAVYDNGFEMNIFSSDLIYSDFFWFNNVYFQKFDTKLV